MVKLYIHVYTNWKIGLSWSLSQIATFWEWKPLLLLSLRCFFSPSPFINSTTETHLIKHPTTIDIWYIYIHCIYLYISIRISDVSDLLGVIKIQGSHPPKCHPPLRKQGLQKGQQRLFQPLIIRPYFLGGGIGGWLRLSWSWNCWLIDPHKVNQPMAETLFKNVGHQPKSSSHLSTPLIRSLDRVSFTESDECWQVEVSSSLQ